MEDPSGHRDLDETHTLPFRLLTMTALFTITAILWRKDFFSGIYRFLVLFKASPVSPLLSKRYAVMQS